MIPGSGRSLGEEDPLGKEMATHSSILAWEIPWTEEPGGLQSMKSQKCHARHSDKQQPQAMPCVKWWEYISFFFFFLGIHFKVAQLCLTLCDPMDYTAKGILQARILEWVAFPFSRGSSQPRDQTQVSCISGRFFTS